MTIDWQTIIVGVIVVACAVYVARFLYHEFAGKEDGCGGSCGCGHEEAKSGKPNAQS